MARGGHVCNGVKWVAERVSFKGVRMMGSRECMVNLEQNRIALKTTQISEGDINK